MKIIHCADIHIGAVMQNLPADKAKVRKRETLDSFFEMLRFAQKNDVAAVIIAGDFFDVRRIARSIRKEILDVIGSYPQIHCLYLTGNHDAKIDLEDGELVIPQNLKRFDAADDWTYFPYDNICIAGIDLEKQNGYGFYEKLKLDKEQFNIAVLHGDLKTISLERLKGRNINYLALGDIHIPDLEPKKLDGRGMYAYSGSLEGHGYDEIGGRGFFLLEVDGGNVTRTFHSVAKRKYEEVSLDITNLDSHFKIDHALRQLTDSRDSGNIIRVVLCGRRKADVQIERENLEKKLTERFFHARVKDQTQLDIGSVTCDGEVSLRSEFVKIVQSSDLSPEEKDRITEYGIKALCGEAIE